MFYFAKFIYEILYHYNFFEKFIILLLRCVIACENLKRCYKKEYEALGSLEKTFPESLVMKKNSSKFQGRVL